MQTKFSKIDLYIQKYDEGKIKVSRCEKVQDDFYIGTYLFSMLKNNICLYYMCILPPLKFEVLSCEIKIN